MSKISRLCTSFYRAFFGLFFLIFFAQISFGQVSGTVFIDNNGNGTQDNSATYRERGLGGVTVTAYRSNGSVAATTISDAATCGAEGAYTLPLVAGDYPVRIEFVAPSPYEETFSQNTSVQFLNGPVSNINYGVSEPGAYADVTKGFNVISSIAAKNGFGGPEVPIVKSFGYHSGGNGGGPLGTVEHATDTYGFLRGIGTDNLHKKVYYSQGTKNFVRNGSTPNNPSTKIFQSDFNNPNTTALNDYLNLASVGLPVATFTNESKGYYPTSWDNGFNTNTPFDWEANWGRVGLGDLDIDKKNEKGYVISMSTQQLISFPVNRAGTDFTRFSSGDLLPSNAMPNATQIARFDIPYPGDGINGGAVPPNNFDATYIPNHKDDWFVDGLGIHKGKVYVGVSNPRMYPRVGQYTGSNYTNFNGSAYIIYYSFDPQTGAWARVMDAYMGDQLSGFLQAECCRPTPFPFVASDIDFDSYNDEMILSVKNLRGDFNINPNSLIPNPQTTAEYGGNNYFIPHMAYRAFPSTPGAATYKLEYSTGANAGTVDRCGSNYAPPVAPTATPWGNGNNYNITYGIQEQLGSVINGPSHENYYNSYEGADGFGFIGASATFPGGNEAIFYYSDPQNSQSGGINWIPNDANGPNFRSEMWGGSPAGPYFGKGQGVGDIELIYDVAPIEIGNRVWLDIDGDGVQDPGEATIAGVTVELLDDSGAVIATAVTDANGNYYFSNASGSNTGSAIYGLSGLLYDSDYTIRIPNISGGSKQVALGINNPTTANAGGAGQPDVRDSDGTVSGTSAIVKFRAGSAGQNNHSFDFGFRPLPPCTPPSAPTLSVTNNTCAPFVNGTINVTTACGAGTRIEYSTDNGSTWSATAPTYGNSSITVVARCVTDADATCFSPNSAAVTTAPVTCPPPPPAPPCSITITQQTQSVCNNNGTNRRAQDDYFTVSVNATAISGGAQYEVVNLANTDGTGGNPLGFAQYGTAVTVGSSGNLIANNTAFTLTVRDLKNNACFKTITLNPVPPCSSNVTAPPNGPCGAVPCAPIKAVKNGQN